MVSQALLKQWKQDESAPFRGWDFSYIAGRLSEDHPSWDYAGRAAALSKGATSLLDVDTGGGEFLQTLSPLPPQTWAAESYPPNVEAARARLAPLGAQVVHVAVGEAWPFSDGQFDLILNRHGHLNAKEIARCLAPGGTFFTQQVSSDNLEDLRTLFDPRPISSDNRLPSVSAALEAHGLSLQRAAAWQGRQAFADIGALIYFLKAVPWVVDDFKVETHMPTLEALQARVDDGHALAFKTERFLIQAQKPTN